MAPTKTTEATAADSKIQVARSPQRGHNFDRALLHALQSARRGEFSIRLPNDQGGMNGRIADAFNDIVSAAAELVQQLEFVGQHVGQEGETRHRVRLALPGGAWSKMESTVNALIDDLLWPTMAVTDSIAAVARGDLLRTVRLDVGGRPLQGEFLRLATIVNRMIEQLSVFTSEVTRVAREVGTEGKLGGQAQVHEVSGVWRELTESVNSMASNLTAQVRNIADVTIAVANGDLSKKITVDVRGEILQLKEAINTMVDQLRSFASEVTRVAREVGTDGKLGGQAIVPGVAGTWKDLTDSVNAMCGSLTDQVRNIAQVTTAVARGDLSRKITVDVRGEILELKNTINTMVDQLNGFASEVTRVAREVGTEGRLGGQAQVPGVAGTWKDLTDNVNSMAFNLTAQVRNIAEVATAVARGDLSKKVTVDVQGEIQQLKRTINTMVDQLNRFAGEVTRVAHEVGTEGRLGGQAAVPGVAGTWKDLTGNVNHLAANLTTQVRAIAEVATAVTKGDLTRSVEVEARGEVADLKNDINTMILNLRLTTERNTEQAWLNMNLARFSNMLQGQRDLVTIGRMMLVELAPLVGAQFGVIYIVKENIGSEPAVLNLLAAYADTVGQPGHPVRLRLGEGLIGQCAADARRLLITDIPTDGALISSGLFRAAPRTLVVLPISFEGKVKAVIELASFGSFTPLQISFLEQLTASIGIVFNSIEATMRTEDLLKQTQMLAAKLQAQQQELQQRVAERTAELAEINAGLERRVEERTREREAALAQVHEMQKLESLGQLTGGVAHDFNNLLATIIGNLEMMAAVLPEDGAVKRYTEAALSAATRGSGLTQHLLAFSRRQEIRPQTVNINDILNETLLLCRQTTGEGIEIESRLNPDAWPCHIDPAQFEAAILNLAVNARDAMSRSGRLRITTENRTLGDGYAADLRSGDYVVVSVSDTGCGMTEEILQRAFEPFYTTKDIGKGTGLGLSQVYGFAKQSGGSAQVESEVDRGTTVHIFIPRCDVPPPAEASAAEDITPSKNGNATILVVEDDPNVREMVVNMLINFGYQPLVAGTGPEALALLQNSGSVDLLLSDVVMPAGMSGTELARAAQRLRPDLKILLTSGHTGVEPEPGVIDQFPFIPKPYRAQVLGRKLEEILGVTKAEPIPIDDISGNRLLLIDDDPAVGRLVETVAQSCGFEVVLTEDPRSFAITARSWNPTVIMVDLKIPGTDGIQLLRTLAADQCTADIVVTSGSDQKVLDSALQLGRGRGLKMRGLLPKPMGVEQLREMLVGFRRLPRDLFASDLAEAISSNQLFLEYQPKFDCDLGHFTGVEALVRWRHPDHGIINPSAFIPIAEESNLIHRLTDWVVRAAATQAALWQASGRSLEVAVNISAFDIDDLELPERLAQHCAGLGIGPDSMILELTETGAMRQAVQMMDVLTRLRLKGFKLSIDDFGTGYSSLVQLQQLPFSEAKIDQSFVRRLMKNRDCLAIVEITIELARRLGLKIVAEGVEDEPTLNCLIQMGCHVAQGFHLSRPVPADRIEAVIHDQSLIKAHRPLLTDVGSGANSPVPQTRVERPVPDSRSSRRC